jgi:predicted MPP superfamily phosphohydrolase
MQRKLTRRTFLKTVTRLTLGASLAGVGVGYMYKVEPSWVDITQVKLTLPRLATNFHGYQIGQISDLHAGGWITRQHLQDIVAAANAQATDLIVVTGDFFSGDPDFFAQDIIDTISNFSAPDGVLCILGNHDHWVGAGKVREVLAATPLTELNNAALTIERDRSLLTIVGVDDIWERQNRLDLALNKVPGEGAAILLAHEPDFADEAATTGRFDLQISGHSHGGQVVIPFIGPPHLPYLGQKYHTGLYRIGDMLQYTNRGIGMIRPYVRFNCRPEITVFTLLSQTT